MQPQMNTDRFLSVFICGFVHTFGCGWAALWNSWPIKPTTNSTNFTKTIWSLWSLITWHSREKCCNNWGEGLALDILRSGRWDQEPEWQRSLLSIYSDFRLLTPAFLNENKILVGRSTHENCRGSVTQLHDIRPLSPRPPSLLWAAGFGPAICVRAKTASSVQPQEARGCVHEVRLLP